MYRADGGPPADVALSEAAVMARGKASVEYIKDSERLTSLPLPGADNSIAGVVNLQEDCSEQHRLKESVRRVSAKLAVVEAELEQIRITDPSTGLFNKSYIAGKLQEQIELCSAQNQKFSVVLIDVKILLNDRQEPEKKWVDGILKKTSGCIKRFLRHSDTAGYIGGGLFLIIMPKTSHSEAEKVADKFSENSGKDPGLNPMSLYSYEFPFGNSETMRKEVSDLLNIKQDT